MPEPPALKYLHTLLLAAEDTHEARTHVFRDYEDIFHVAAYEEPWSWNTAKRLAEDKIWKARLRELVTTPSTFFNHIWEEILLSLGFFYDYEEGGRSEESFLGLRAQPQTLYLLRMLHNGYGGQFTDFVVRLVEEQPRYFDRPSNLDEILAEQTHPDHFPALEELSVELDQTGRTDTPVFVRLLIHQVAYTCSLFTQTDYNPSGQVLEDCSQYRVGQLSRMFADVTSPISLQARHFCASMNHRGINDFIVLQGKEILRTNEGPYLSWLLYRWFLRCVKRTFGDEHNEFLVANFYPEYGLQQVADPGTVAIEDYAPEGLAGIRVPEHVVRHWQNFNAADLEDVQFKAVGPRILVKNVAKPVQPLRDSLCAVCLEGFDIRKTAMVAWKVVCGHIFHAHCLKEMVNGVEPNSNLCPLCRVNICRSRERTSIVQAEDGEAADG